MAIIKAPVPFSGIRGNLVFVDGVSDTNDAWLIKWFKEHGYKVEPDAAELKLLVPEPDLDEGGGIGDMTVKELKAYAADKGIDLGEAKTKADIVAAIEAAEAVDGDDEHDEGGGNE